VIAPDHVPEQFRAPSDAARRCADAVNLAAVAGVAGTWLAVRLADGGSDRVPYDSREAAISHQLHPEHCTYVQVPPGGMRDYEAEALLDYWRKLASRGVRNDNPDVALPLMPLTGADRRRQIRVLARGHR
jgi:hypothetical protein